MSVSGQGMTPAAATPEKFAELGVPLLDLSLHFRSFSTAIGLSLPVHCLKVAKMPGQGLLAACTPGAYDAWMLLLATHGTMRPRAVLGKTLPLPCVLHCLRGLDAAVALCVSLPSWLRHCHSACVSCFHCPRG